MLRILKLSLTSFLLMLLISGLFGAFFGVLDIRNEALSIITAILSFISSIVISIRLFRKKQKVGSSSPNISTLGRENMITRVNFKVSRAFEVAEYEDEGRHLFLEVENGILYLNSQALYEYKPHEFPSSQICTLRHKNDGYLVGIESSGHPIPIEGESLTFSDSYFRVLDSIYEDGEIIKIGFEKLKRLIDKDL